tara:strand:+ start:495 stop:905 length:411 start_codon:yes stop_codon:yes gene_type:complete
MNRQKIESLDSYPFKYKLSTRWRDQDPFKHVNHAIFLNYLEDARTNLFKRWSIDYEKKSVIVASMKIDYLAQVSHPSELLIAQRISRIGTKSFDIEAVIFNNKVPCCASTVTTVCFDFINGKSVDVFEEIVVNFNV